MALFVGSVVPALLFGVAMGNLLLGVPFQYDPISLRFIYTGSFFGLLRPYALLCGLISVALLTMHGAAYLALRAEGVIHERASRALKIAGSVFLILFVLAGVGLNFISGYHLVSLPDNPIAHPLNNVISMTRGGWLINQLNHTWVWVAPLITVAGVVFAMIQTTKNQIN